MPEQHKIVEPAQGEVIRPSMLKLLVGIAVLLAALITGILILWAWWTETSVLRYEHVTGPQAFGALLMTAIAGLFTPLLLVFLFVRERLIVARDRLQLVRSFRGDTVDLQIPYANLAEIAIANDEGGVEFLGIKLRDPADPDTFVAGWDFATTDASDGWHYHIPDVYQRSLAEIHELVLQRLRAMNVSP